MAASKTTPLLSLDTLESYTVAIDGKHYGLYAPDALPAFTYKRLSTVSIRVGQLWQSESLTPEEDQELANLLDELCRLVLQAPPEVHVKLSDVQRLAVFQTFQQLPTSMLRTVAQRMQTGAKRTGVSLPHASRGSTAATHSNGSRRSRSGSSARANG